MTQESYTVFIPATAYVEITVKANSPQTAFYEAIEQFMDGSESVYDLIDSSSIELGNNKQLAVHCMAYQDNSEYEYTSEDLKDFDDFVSFDDENVPDEQTLNVITCSDGDSNILNKKDELEFLMDLYKTAKTSQMPDVILSKITNKIEKILGE